ncbi:MAG: histidine kinase [Bacteroidetes bacterium]|nr:histidine kinase [Bacteroidota bacterium]
MLKTFRRWVLFILMLIFSVAQAQNKIIDSVKTVLANPKLHDTARLRIIQEVALNRFTNNFDPNFHKLTDMMGALALKNYKQPNSPQLRNKYGNYLASYYSSQATLMMQKEEYDKSEQYFDKSIALHKASGSYNDMYTGYLEKAQLYSKINKEDKAIALIFEVLKYYEKDKKSNLQSLYYVYTTLAYLYRNQKEYDKAIESSLKAKHYCDLSYKEAPSNHTLGWKGSNDMNLSYCNSQLKRYKEALVYAYNGIEIFKKLGAELQTTLCLTGAADMEMKLSNFSQAEKLYQEILKQQTAATNPMTLAGTYYGLGTLSLKKGDLKTAEEYQEKAFEASKKTTNKSLQKDIAEELYKINLEKKNYEKALRYFEFDKKIADSTQTASSKKEISQQLLKYEFEKKELQQKIIQQKKLEALKLQAAKEKADAVAKGQLAQQQLKYDFDKKQLNDKIAQGKKLAAVKLASQKKTAAVKLEGEKKNAVKNNWLIGLSGLLLLLVLGGFFYYRNNKQKQEIAGLEKNQIKQKLLITQMNPHFIFNSVQNIRNLIDNHKNGDAVKYLDQFSVLTRQILENANENYISLEEEVAMLENYLSIQQLLYNHKFDYRIHLADDLDPESVFLPPMLTQPFIENAIKHGLSAVSQNGKIDIRFFLEANKLFFEVTDNGKGFDAQKTTSNHKSLAMTITKERLVGYTKNQDFVVQTDNLKDEDQKVVGAQVRFEIPYIYEN